MAPRSWLLLLLGIPVLARADERPVSFTRDVRPILTERCFLCHGPDSKANKGDLRLNSRESATRNRDGQRVIVPGNSGASELMRRITSNERGVRMPPRHKADKLSPTQIAVLRKWIDSGAKYDLHWAFEPPRRPPLPAVSDRSWPRNAIDYFVLRRLDEDKLRPSARADRETLLRRVSLDLVGLPPTPNELEAFLGDLSPDAYERAVDRLLASPRFGERSAIHWLDAARYADTHGYLFDTQRTMWRWRDWVIESFNSNKPFDKFTVEQLAGDLLPEPTLDQRIATGFNRNHQINNEAGAIPQEYLVENVLDRVNTTATVWMGLTLGCAQCHDHKYDPISQKEYYQLYAFFNQVAELGLDGFNKNAVPLLKAPTPEQKRRLEEHDQRLVAAEQKLDEVKFLIDGAQSAWEEKARREVAPVTEGLVLNLPLDGYTEDGSEFKANSPTYKEGLLGESAELDGLRYIESKGVGDFDEKSRFTLSLWIRPDRVTGRMGLLSRMEGAKTLFRGYALQVVEGLVVLYLVRGFPDEMIQVQTRTKLEPNRWYHITATYDGSGKAKGVTLYLDGELQKVARPADKLSGSIETDEPFHVGNGHPNAKFVGRIDEVRIYDRILDEKEVRRLPGVSIDSLLTLEEEGRTAEHSRRVRKHYLDNHAKGEWAKLYRDLIELQEQKKELVRSIPTAMVMKDRDEFRNTFVLERGAYDKLGERVSANTPAALPALPKGAARNRLTLARWLVSPRHPLTARVIVNRYWQRYFGAGLVRTPEDFGLQGDYPSHPKLLDWLATEFVRSGWDVKHLHRLIVTSATYRQSSAVSKELFERDPENRLLARASRVRLPAEVIRDQALAASGLLVERLGGPSVKPYQPAGLWREVAFDPSGAALTAQVFQQDRGANLYRRSLYTFWKRTAPPPTMLLFDAPDRERCSVRRHRTNTPLQALVLMNSPTYVEAARKLAERALTVAGASPEERVRFMFRVVLGRAPKLAEVRLLVDLYRQERAEFAKNAKAVWELLKVGESVANPKLDPTEVASFTSVASVLLNLDETLTRR